MQTDLPPKDVDLTGMRIGKLEILKPLGDFTQHGWRGIQWLTRCECGREVTASGYGILVDKGPRAACPSCMGYALTDRRNQIKTRALRMLGRPKGLASQWCPTCEGHMIHKGSICLRCLHVSQT